MACMKTAAMLLFFIADSFISASFAMYITKPVETGVHCPRFCPLISI